MRSEAPLAPVDARERRRPEWRQEKFVAASPTVAIRFNLMAIMTSIPSIG